MRGDRLVEGPLLPLLIRGVLLAAGTAIAMLAVGDPAVVVGLVLAFFVVISLGAVPLPNPTARVVQAFAEIAALGLVIGSAGELGLVFAPLLLLPAFTVGQRGGLLLGALGGATGGLAWTLGILSRPLRDELLQSLGQAALWSILLVATGLIGGWVRRLTLQTRSFSDTAYEDAFRLLSELQEVARNLSLGLDPATLGAALLEDVAHVHPGGRRVLAVAGSSGRLAPLVAGGDERGSDEEVAAAAWTSGRRASATAADGQRSEAFPVRMGSRVVAVLTVTSEGLVPAAVAHVEELVKEAGPRLAAALTFDEVRQLATVDERLRLAREIHDGVAQELASVGYLLDDVADRVPPEAALELQGLRQHVRSVVGELRLSIFDLRAGVDDKIGLGTALSEHVQRIGQQSSLVVHTVLDEQGGRLPAAVEVELLRIAQEAVTNVRKHAQANNLWVDCTIEAPRAWLRIADDGVGLQPAKPQSMGIRGMRERVRRIGGDLIVTDRPGGGTVVEVTVGSWDEETSR